MKNYYNQLRIGHKKRLFGLLLPLLLVFSINVLRAEGSEVRGMIDLQQESNQRTINGEVLDDQGNPVPGATVLIKGTSSGVTTDMNGQYSIVTPENATTLVFSFIGFVTQEVEIEGQATINIELETDLVTLNEVVIDGYSTVSRKRLTSSVGIVETQKLEQLPTASFDQALQGQSSGVQVLMDGRAPGSSATIRVRGNRSLTTQTEALFIVDGIQLSGEEKKLINPNDFESVQVLKDASAVALYGSRGANGVVVITTKKGKAGEGIKVNFNSSFGVGKAIVGGYDLMSTEERGRYEREYLFDGPLLYPDDFDFGQMPDESYSQDWYDLWLRNSTVQSYQVSATGGGKDMGFFMSANYYDQKGLLKGTDMKRGTVRANLNFSKGKFRADFKNSLGYGVQNEIGGHQFLNMATMLPYFRVRDDQGNYLGTNYAGDGIIEDIDKNTNRNKLLNVTSMLDLHYNITENISVGSRTSINYNQIDNFNAVPPTNRTAMRFSPNNQGTLALGNMRSYRVINTNSVNFNKDFDKHSLGIGLFQEAITSKTEHFSVNGFGLHSGLSPLLIQDNIYYNNYSDNNLNLVPKIGGDWDTKENMLSYFAILDYAYDGKYIFRGTFRRDGSSKFGENNKWGNFYSVALGWVVSSEDFFQSDAISYLKVRGSYGKTGNQDESVISPFQSLATYTQDTYIGLPAIYKNKIAYSNLKWEVSNQFNFGVDVNLFKDRINATIEYYNITTDDLFVARPIPQTSGFGSLFQNYGKIRNSGVELALNAQLYNKNDWNVNFFLNTTYNKSKAIEFNEEGELLINTDGSLVHVEGERLFKVRVYEKAGIDPENGDYIFRNPDGTLTQNLDDAELVDYGYAESPWFGGFGANISYKGFTLGAQFNWDYGATKLDATKYEIEFPMWIDQNVSRKLLTAWQKPGDISEFPDQSKYAGTDPIQQLSDYWVDASFLRFKALTLSYNLPKNICEKLSTVNVRLYFRGDNLITWTKWEALDPETSGFAQEVNGEAGSATTANYPNSRTFSFGIDVTF